MTALKWLLGVVGICALLIAVCIASVLINGGKVTINEEYSGIVLVNPYRSWKIRYSQGQQFQTDGTTKNLWCKPTFERVEFKPFPASAVWVTTNANTLNWIVFTNSTATPILLK